MFVFLFEQAIKLVRPKLQTRIWGRRQQLRSQFDSLFLSSTELFAAELRFPSPLPTPPYKLSESRDFPEQYPPKGGNMAAFPGKRQRYWAVPPYVSTFFQVSFLLQNLLAFLHSFRIVVGLGFFLIFVQSLLLSMIG